MGPWPQPLLVFCIYCIVLAAVVICWRSVQFLLSSPASSRSVKPCAQRLVRPAPAARAGKHSGRNALRTRLSQLGFDLPPEQLDDVFKRFKARRALPPSPAAGRRALCARACQRACFPLWPTGLTG